MNSADHLERAEVPTTNVIRELEFAKRGLPLYMVESVVALRVEAKILRQRTQNCRRVLEQSPQPPAG